MGRSYVILSVVVAPMDANEILARGASTWTSQEARFIEDLMKELGRDKVKQMLIEARGGEKPQIINNQ